MEIVKGVIESPAQSKLTYHGYLEIARGLMEKIVGIDNLERQ
jgi:hypothetical protein